MSRQDDLLTDVRLTGQEASRLLHLLEQDVTDDSVPKPSLSDSVSSDSVSTDSVPSGLQTPETGKAESSSGCWLVLLFLGLMVGCGVVIAALVDGINGSTSTENAELGFQTSCGSRFSDSGRWWPVLGVADRSLLSTVRDSYCGDAYINEDGALQVASFATEDDAGAFAEQLSRATGSSFRVGQSNRW